MVGVDQVSALATFLDSDLRRLESKYPEGRHVDVDEFTVPVGGGYITFTAQPDGGVALCFGEIGVELRIHEGGAHQTLDSAFEEIQRRRGNRQS